MHNDKTVLLAPSTKKIGDRIVSVFGRQFFNQLLPVEISARHARISGYIGKPELTRSSRSHQFLFVNRRPIVSQGIGWAVAVAYRNLLMKGRYPVFILFLDVDPASVDVNVHPTKREIRFRNEWELKEGVSEAIRSVLSQMDLSPEVASPIPKAKPSFERTAFEKKLSETEQGLFLPGKPSVGSGSVERAVPERSEPSTEELAVEDEEAKETVEIEEPRESRPLTLRYLGQLMKSYIMAEDDDGLVMIDQHAAHERVLYERLSREIAAGGTNTQRMLVPATIEVTAGEAMIIESSMDQLHRLGFIVRLFGRNTFIIEAIPDYVRMGDQEGIIRDILDELKQERSVRSAEREKAVQYAVCRAAVKARDSLTEKEALGLLKDLQSCQIPYTCPHGRPTMIRMPLSEIEKQFKRR